MVQLLGFFSIVNQPLFESEKVEGCNADQLLIDLGLDTSDLLNDSPANRFNESESQKLRDEPLSQAVTKLQDPSNVFDDDSHDENRNPQVQLSHVQIPTNKKVLLRQAASPPPSHACVCLPPSPAPPVSSDTGPIMTFEDRPTPKKCGTYKARARTQG